MLPPDFLTPSIENAGKNRLRGSYAAICSGSRDVAVSEYENVLDLCVDLDTLTHKSNFSKALLKSISIPPPQCRKKMLRKLPRPMSIPPPQ
jgi:hypothetical protein